jgi:ABC-2 type transport system ATP-binding protein
MEEADHLCRRVAIMDHGHVVALDTPDELKRSLGADTVVTVRTEGNPTELSTVLRNELTGVTRTRCADDTLELHVTGARGLVPRVVNVAESAGFDITDLSIADPTLETVFIHLTGRELRET